MKVPLSAIGKDSFGIIVGLSGDRLAVVADNNQAIAWYTGDAPSPDTVFYSFQQTPYRKALNECDRFTVRVVSDTPKTALIFSDTQYTVCVSPIIDGISTKLPVATAVMATGEVVAYATALKKLIRAAKSPENIRYTNAIWHRYIPDHGISLSASNGYYAINFPCPELTFTGENADMPGGVGMPLDMARGIIEAAKKYRRGKIELAIAVGEEGQPARAVACRFITEPAGYVRETIAAKCPPGIIPAFENLIPAAELTADFDVDRALSALKAALPAAKLIKRVSANGPYFVILTVAPGKLTLAATWRGETPYCAEIPATTNVDQPIKIGCNPDHLIDALNVLCTYDSRARLETRLSMSLPKRNCLINVIKLVPQSSPQSASASPDSLVTQLAEPLALIVPIDLDRIGY